MKSTEPIEVSVKVPGAVLQGELTIPDSARGLVVFAHSPRRERIAPRLRQEGLGTLLVELLTPEEERVDAHTRHLRYDVALLGRRLASVLDWLSQSPEAASLPLVLFGSSTGAAAALIAASDRPELVCAVVSKGGRPDLAGPRLARVQSPTLLVVGGRDLGVLELNQEALLALGAPVRELVVVPGASHTFEEPGALEEVTRQSARWFRSHARGTATSRVTGSITG